MINCPRQPFLSGPKSGCLMQVWLYITFSTEQISHMQFVYVQDVYRKNQLGILSAEKEL